MFVCLFVCFKTGFLYVALAVLNSLCRPGWPRTHKPASFCLPGAGIKGMRYDRLTTESAPQILWGAFRRPLTNLGVLSRGNALRTLSLHRVQTNNNDGERGWWYRFYGWSAFISNGKLLRALLQLSAFTKRNRGNMKEKAAVNCRQLLARSR